MGAVIKIVCLLVVTGALCLPAGPDGETASRIPDRGPVVPSLSENAPLVTVEQVKVWITKWQKRLGLDEWAIDAKVVRSWDLPQGAVANIHWSLPKRKATIKVLNSVDSSLRRSEIPRDTELSVVHELVHLSMAKLPLDPNHTELEEDTVKKLSTALLALETAEAAKQ